MRFDLNSFLSPSTDLFPSRCHHFGNVMCCGIAFLSKTEGMYRKQYDLMCKDTR